jgi:hypothetical protein
MSFKVFSNLVSATAKFPLRRLTTVSTGNSILKSDAEIQAHFDRHVNSLERSGYKCLSFKDYKFKHMKTFEAFSKDHDIQILYKENAERIPNAYERYCTSNYSRYLHYRNGGNPATAW